MAENHTTTCTFGATILLTEIYWALRMDKYYKTQLPD